MVILARRVLILLGVIGLAAAPGWTQQAQAERQGFWGNLQIRYGSLELISDPGTHERQGALSLGFDLEGTLNRHVRLGREINGWLLLCPHRKIACGRWMRDTSPLATTC